MADEAILKNRFKDLAGRSYRENRYTYTNFLSLADQSDFFEIEKELSYAGSKLFGGNEWCERKVLRFGNADAFGYEEDFPVTALEIAPLNAKFADDLTHRDFLGALMNLGIEREMLGDIFRLDKGCVLYCLDSMADYIIENLSRIKHTSVMARRFEGDFVLPESSRAILTIQVSSERCDAVVARVFNISRDDSLSLFREQKVFINGRMTTGNDTKVKEGDRVSVRGFGKFDVNETAGVSRKGKLNIRISLYR